MSLWGLFHHSTARPAGRIVASDIADDDDRVHRRWKRGSRHLKRLLRNEESPEHHDMPGYVRTAHEVLDAPKRRFGRDE